MAICHRRWTTEMLAEQVGQEQGIQIHASTIRYLLPKLGIRWDRARPTLCVKGPGKNQKRYLAGALNAATGKVVWVEWKKKNSEIFILLLAEPERVV